MELSSWKELVLLSVLSFYSILIFWYFFHPIIQYFISHILKSTIFIKFNSQFTCNNSIVTYKSITYCIDYQSHAPIFIFFYFNSLR